MYKRNAEAFPYDHRCYGKKEMLRILSVRL
jgi:hypothetical protein